MAGQTIYKNKLLARRFSVGIEAIKSINRSFSPFLEWTHICKVKVVNMKLKILKFFFLFPVFLLAQDFPMAPEVWSEPVRIDAVHEKYVWTDSPSLTKNLDTLIYMGSGGKVWTSVLTDGQWQPPEPLSSKVNDDAVIRHPMLSRDGKRLYTSAWGGYGGWDLWVNEWDDSTRDWKKAKNMGPVINSENWEYYLYEVSPDTVYTITTEWATYGAAMYIFDSAGAKWKLFNNFEYHPLGGGYVEGLSITSDYKKLYFANESSLWEDYKKRSYELCVCYWDTLKNNWGEPYFLNINTKTFIPDSGNPDYRLGGFEKQPWISHDGKTLYFASNRDAAIEDSVNYTDIYYSRLLIDENGDTVTAFKEKDNKFFVKEFQLFQNYPNPFNNETVIKYRLSVISDVELAVYNLLGEKVAQLVKKKQPAGKYSVIFDASKFNLSSGVYIVSMKCAGFYEYKKIMYLK